MSKPLKIFLGWDARDELAFRACVSSIHKHASVPVEITPLKDYELRRLGWYWRSYTMNEQGQRFDSKDGKPFSTDFSFTRFLVPLIACQDEVVLFCDADMLFKDDVAKLFAAADPTKAIQCVQHVYEPQETSKFDGMLQERYFRKNWSSMMLLHPAQCKITKHMVNTQTGSWLHGMFWQEDKDIGALPECWNWLEGWSPFEQIPPSVVHFTRGTPDMLGNDLPFADEWWRAVQAWQPNMNRHGLNG